MDYIIVVQNPAYQISDNSFATESAFAEHLKELHRSLEGRFSRLILIAPHMSVEEYNAKSRHLGVINSAEDGVEFVSAYPAEVSAAGFWLRHAGRVWGLLTKVLKDPSIVHSGMATDIRWPLLAFANLAAARMKRPVLFIVDIDFRDHTKRSRQLGAWSTPRYLVNLLVLDPFKLIQVKLAVRMFQLVMLKSASMVRDFGHDKPNVKNFYDTVHAESHILSAGDAAHRIDWLSDVSRPFQLCYFGRLVASKGVASMIEAVRLARIAGCDARLSIIGDGPELEGLQHQVEQADLIDFVSFLPQVPYGPALFEKLSGAHMTMAAPLVEDTPRSAFDSMARGLPILAFDISYFKDLAEFSGAVALASWPSAEEMAKQIVSLSADRTRVSEMALRGLSFAHENTQQVWLERRMDWLLLYMLGETRGTKAAPPQ
jgi:glycosyltransferase involved in cell wall biosynthesis